MKTTIRNLVCAGTIIAGAVSIASADPVVYDNGGAFDGNGLSSQYDTAYPFESHVADDFVLGSNTTVTAVNWCGLYWNPGTPHNATSFNILFFADNGFGSAPIGGPGSEFASFNIGIGSVTVSSLGGDAEAYSASLGAGVALSAGTTYWMAIQAVSDYPPQWGWGSNGLGGNSVQGFPLLGVAYWTGTGFDQCFSLEGVVPAPGAMALLGLGGLVTARRRR